MNAPTLLLPLIEEFVNRLLRLDPQTLTRLGELDGKAVCVQVGMGTAAPLTLYMALSESGLRMLTAHDAPDVTIRGNVPLFARLLLGDEAPSPSTSAALHISGDIKLGQRFQRILQSVDIDWEEQTSHVIGDIAAHQLARAVRALRAWGREAMRTIGQDVAEYLHEEVRLLAKRPRVDAFLNEVDRLRADVDRLQKRVERLTERAR